MKKRQQATKLAKEFESSNRRTGEVMELIRRMEKAEKLSSIAAEKQQGAGGLQILPGNQTGVVFSLHR